MIELIKLFLEFLKAPSGLGTVIVLALVGLFIYAFPLWLVTETSKENTARLEAAIFKTAQNCSEKLVSKKYENVLTE